MIKVCVQCGREFETNRSNAILCSEECRKLRAKEQFKTYYTNNKEKHNKVCREYNKKYPKKIKTAMNKFHENNPNYNGVEKTAEKIGITAKEYNKEVIRKRAELFGLTPKEYRSLKYKASKEGVPFYSKLGFDNYESYREVLKNNKITWE